ncbi:hypothetical protein [Bacillus phage SWEP1]|nr:hypothetical protein [Bacillus phage SWEP1]
MTRGELKVLVDELEDIMWETTDCSSYARLKKIMEELDKKYDLYR